MPSITKPVLRAAITASTRAVDAIALAMSLRGIGMGTNSALVLATAAQLLLDHQPDTLKATPQQKFAGEPTARGTKAAATVDLDVGSLLAAAESMSRNDPGVSALVSQLQRRAAAGSKGATGGAKFRASDALAHSTDIYQIAFRGSELASVRVVGDGDTDLDCYVYSSGGTLVASDVNYSDDCVLDWWPSVAGTYRIEIRNLGDVYNRYTIVTN